MTALGEAEDLQVREADIAGLLIYIKILGWVLKIFYIYAILIMAICRVMGILPEKINK